jgi:hypothetical protein
MTLHTIKTGPCTWAKVTEARYAAAIPPCCEYQSIDQHLEDLTLCRTILASLENDQPVNCGRCYLATRTVPTSTPTTTPLETTP